MKPWTDAYLSIPYQDGGRTRDGADCLGLYAIILAERVGKSLPDYVEHWGGGADAILARMECELMAGRWLKVDKARELDCIRMTGHAKGSDGIVRRAAVHMGCAIGSNKMIHTEDKRGPRIVRLDDEMVRRRIVGIYRPVFLQ